jgi:hypothetical protein
MTTKAVLALNMFLCGIGGLIWNHKDIPNVFIKLLLLCTACMDLIVLLHLEGYIVKIIK